MKSKGNNPTALEIKWRGIVADFANTSSWLDNWFGDYTDTSAFELDHILGAQAKRKVNFVSVKVGEFAIIPIPYELHNVMCDHKYNKTLRPAAFREHFESDSFIFDDMISTMKSYGYEIPFSQNIIDAIIKG